MKFWISVLVLLGCVGGANASNVSADVWGGTVVGDADIYVDNGVYFQPARLEVNKSIKIENNGDFNTDVFVCDMCRVSVINRGDMTGNFYLGQNAKLIQVVEGAGDLMPINFNADYTLVVSGDDVLRWNEILSVAHRADKVVLNNVMVDMNVGARYLNQTNIELVGEIKVLCDDLKNLYGVAIMENVSGNGKVRFIGGTDNPLFANVGFVENGNLYVRRERETDYVKIFNNETGAFLNKLRGASNGGADRLLKRLDTADSVDEFNKMMGRSVRFNPGNLIQILETVNAFSMNRFDVIAENAGVRSFVIGAKDFYVNGIGVGVGAVVKDRIEFGLNFDVGRVKYESDVDKFDGRLYGLDFAFLYKMGDERFLNLLSGVRFMRFDVGDVLYNKSQIKNPRGNVGYMLADYSEKYSLGDSFYIMPGVGVGLDFYKIEAEENMDVFGRAKIGAGYEFDMIGIHYDYKVQATVDTDTDVMLGGRIEFWSEYDQIGAGAEISAGRVNNQNACEFLIDANIAF